MWQHIVTYLQNFEYQSLENLEKQIYYIVQAFLAIFIGAAIGAQRKVYEKSAGPRTYALVSFSSCLIAIASVQMFKFDDSRLVAGIVTGIGFLGAGTILHKRNEVQGLTTAAGLWMMATLGILIGLNMLILAIFSALFTYLILSTDDRNFQSFSLFRKKKKTEAEKVVMEEEKAPAKKHSQGHKK